MDRFRAEYQRKAEVQLSEWTRRVESLEDDALQTADAEFKKQVARLIETREKAWWGLEQMKSADDTSWDDYKLGLENSLSQLRKQTQSLVVDLQR